MERNRSTERILSSQRTTTDQRITMGRVRTVQVGPAIPATNRVSTLLAQRSMMRRTVARK